MTGMEPKGKQCVIPGCISQACDLQGNCFSPYCSKYHQNLDPVPHHFASMKGYFLVDGYWGPPWPHLLQPSFSSVKSENIWEEIYQIPPSPEIGMSFQTETEEKMELVNRELSPESYQISTNHPPPLYGNISPKLENIVHSFDDPDEVSWQTKVPFSKRKAESLTSEGIKISRLQRHSNESSKGIQLFENPKSENKRRFQPTLALQYKSKQKLGTGGGLQRKQLNIGEYFHRK
jgi:hypothetical protein